MVRRYTVRGYTALKLHGNTLTRIRSHLVHLAASHKLKCNQVL